MKYVKLAIYREKIVYYYPSNKIPLRISTGLPIKKEDTDKKGNIKTHILNKNPNILEKLRFVNEWINNFNRQNNHLPPKDLIKRRIKGDIEPQYKKNKYFVDFFNDFHTFKKNDLEKRSSLKDYTTFFNTIKDYEKYTNKKLKIYDIDKKFISDFKIFMSRKHIDTKSIKYKTSGKLKNNTMIKRFNVLITFFNWLEDEKIIKEFPEHLKKIGIKKQKVYKPYLTSMEIINFYNCDFKNDHKNKIKDIFIFACHTGMRFGDFSHISKNHFVDKKGFAFVRKKAEKVSEEFLVPLTDIANEIRLRHNNNFRMTNQVYNRPLQETDKYMKLFND